MDGARQAATSSAFSPRRRGATSRSATWPRRGASSLPFGCFRPFRTRWFASRIAPRTSQPARVLWTSFDEEHVASIPGVVGVKSGMHGDAPAPGRGPSARHRFCIQTYAKGREFCSFSIFIIFFFSSLLNQLLSACFDLTLTVNPLVYRRSERSVSKRFPRSRFER